MTRIKPQQPTVFGYPAKPDHDEAKHVVVWDTKKQVWLLIPREDFVKGKIK